MNIKVKKLKPHATIPLYACAGDAGMDLFAAVDTIIRPGEIVAVATGIAMEIPDGYAGLIWDKSGLAIFKELKIFGGVIDAGYRGEIKVGVRNFNTNDHIIRKGDKIAQMLIQKVECANIIIAEELSETDRGSGGFGSTGI